MCNNLKTINNEEIKSEGILIFKDTMEYLIDGILTAEQYAELTRMIYATRWGDGIKEKEIKDKLLLGIWKTLKHTIKKSARNARYRENNQNKKSALQETVSTEFDLPQTIDEINIIEDFEQLVEDNNQSEEQETNDTPIDNQPPVEENNTHEFNTKEIEEIIKEKNNNINDMGNLLTLNPNTGKYEYSNTQKEEIKKKVIEKNTPVQQLNIDDYEPTMIDFKEFVKESYYTIKDIINDFNSQFNIRKQQGNERLRDLLNTRYGRYYHDELVELIIENINKEKVA